ncbi:spermidine/putrescine ABC transporter substrate-binding protein [Corallincola platygyrae]|uniref:polyamine ABC transporter substrate-binding protein n=1 Tax=Corallincola platygyrae TaxID=1193278 RepID=UPI0031E82A85
MQLYTWEEYLAPEVIAQFTKETGHKISQTYFDDEEIRDSVITSGRGEAYDLIMMHGASLQLMAEQGFFHSLDEINAELKDDFDPRWSALCGQYGLPYSWGTVGIVYRTSVSDTPITSWQQLFTPPKEHQGKVVMYMDVLDAPSSALLAIKEDPFTDDKKTLKKAYSLLKEQQKYLLAKEYGYGYALRMKAKSQMTMSLGYSDDQYVMQEETGQSDWVYVVPEEGTLLWAECLAAPTGKPLNAATQAFLRFISRPEVAAKNAETIWFATPSNAALKLTSEEYRSDQALFPNQKILEKSSLYRRLEPKAMRIRERMIGSLE